jgi:hypothetical protein
LRRSAEGKNYRQIAAELKMKPASASALLSKEKKKQRRKEAKEAEKKKLPSKKLPTKKAAGVVGVIQEATPPPAEEVQPTYTKKQTRKTTAAERVFTPCFFYQPLLLLTP